MCTVPRQKGPDSNPLTHSSSLSDNAILEIAGLTYTFEGAVRPTLDDINLSVNRGEFVVVTGPSGCGKSTLALAIGGYLFQQYQGTASGTVFVDGKAARQRPVYEIAEIVGLVQQNPEAQLCTLTVEDEIAFGLENRCVRPGEIDKHIDQALQMVDAPHLRKRHLSTLSGGEKQKVAIAAVLVLKPQILILDEPTSNLDPTATAAVFDVIEEIRAATGITVIVIEHKLGYLMPFAPRVITMNKGQIVSDAKMHQWKTEPGSSAHVTTGAKVRQCIRETLIQATNLSIDFEGHPALHNVSLSVESGEFVIVMGDNGSGKSTLLLSIMGLQKPTRGRVTVLGKDTTETPVSTLARDVGFVFQNPNHQIFASTVWDEATIAPRNLSHMDEDVEIRIRHLLANAGLEDRCQDHPYRLSYGEKRRLNLISVLGIQPRLLLLDEILIGQDVENVAYVLHLLQAAVDQGTTVVMVNHNPEIVHRVATRLLFMERGELKINAPVDQGLQQLAGYGHTAYLPRMQPAPKLYQPTQNADTDADLPSPVPLLICEPQG